MNNSPVQSGPAAVGSSGDVWNDINNAESFNNGPDGAASGSDSNLVYSDGSAATSGNYQGDGRQLIFTINGVFKTATFATNSTFTSGANFVEFAGVTASSGGVISITLSQGYQNEAHLNGIQ